MVETETGKLRAVPQNIAAEQALIGAILMNNRAMEKVVEFLRPEHFANPVHGKIFATCQRLLDTGHVVDPLVIREYFKREEVSDTEDGPDYILKLVDSATSLVNVADYGRQIFDRYLRRQLISLGSDVVNDAFDVTVENDSQQQIETAEKKLYDLANEGELEGGPVPFVTGLKQAISSAEEAMRNPNGISGLSSGLVDMDKLMGGLHNSDLLILAGRPAMGKTALATCIAFNVAKKMQQDNKKADAKKGVAFFSLEMSSEQLAGRILSTYTHIGGQAMRTGKLTGEQFDEIAGALSMLDTLPLYIDDTPGITVQTIKNRARRLKRDKNKGLGLIVIDYLQLISAGGRTENRVQELSEITRALKIMAKELNVPVLVLSQLSRLVEQRDNKRPQLSDLRESGSIEQDADIVMFVYREAYYLENDAPIQKQKETQESFNKRILDWEQRKVDLAKRAEAIVSKQRHGPTGTVHLFFDGQFTEFGNLEQK